MASGLSWTKSNCWRNCQSAAGLWATGRQPESCRISRSADVACMTGQVCKALCCGDREAGREGAESGAGGVAGEGICYFRPDRPGGVPRQEGKRGMGQSNTGFLDRNQFWRISPPGGRTGESMSTAAASIWRSRWKPRTTTPAKEQTPAMAQGITNRALKLEELLGVF